MSSFRSRGLFAASLACVAQPAAVTATQAGTAPPPASARAPAGLDYMVGAWDIIASTPGTDERVRFFYEIRPLVGSVWLAGRARSEDRSLESSDVWGRDGASGELMRLIFDGSGTYAVVRSPGWQGARLVLEGDARSSSGSVRVRETIERTSGDAFVATWQAWRNGAWTTYSVEHATRRPAAAVQPG